MKGRMMRGIQSQVTIIWAIPTTPWITWALILFKNPML